MAYHQRETGNAGPSIVKASLLIACLDLLEALYQKKEIKDFH
jgi:hypothetical protein